MLYAIIFSAIFLLFVLVSIIRVRYLLIASVPCFVMASVLWIMTAYAISPLRPGNVENKLNINSMLNLVSSSEAHFFTLKSRSTIDIWTFKNIGVQYELLYKEEIVVPYTTNLDEIKRYLSNRNYIDKSLRRK